MYHSDLGRLTHEIRELPRHPILVHAEGHADFVELRILEGPHVESALWREIEEDTLEQRREFLERVLLRLRDIVRLPLEDELHLALLGCRDLGLLAPGPDHEGVVLFCLVLEASRVAFALERGIGERAGVKTGSDRQHQKRRQQSDLRKHVSSSFG